MGGRWGHDSGLTCRAAVRRAEKQLWCRNSSHTECVHHDKVTWIYLGKDERIVMVENVLKSQAWCRMSQSVWVRRDLVLQDSDLRRKNQIIQQLSMAFCILPQCWYSTAVSSSLCGGYVSQESSTHLIVWPKRDLTSFPDMTHQYYFSAHIYLASVLHLEICASISVPWKTKNKHPLSQSLPSAWKGVRHMPYETEGITVTSLNLFK